MKTDNREANVDLIRIISCLAVIAVHIKLPVFTAAGLDRSRLFIYGLVCDSVGAFWMVSGFFMFRKKSFRGMLKSTALRLLLPALIMTFLTDLFSRWLLSEASFLLCLTSPVLHPSVFIKSIFAWYPQDSMVGQFWYLAYYFKAVLWFPLLQPLCSSAEKPTKIRRYLLALALLGMFINDTQALWPLSLGRITTYSVLENHAAIILIGYEIYAAKEKILNSRVFRFGGLAAFAVANIARYFMSFKLLSADATNEYFLSWYPVVSVICMAGLICFCLSFGIKKERTARALSYIGERTFIIFVIHTAVFNKLNSLGLRAYLINALGGDSMSFAAELLFTFAYALSVFIICLVITALLKYIKLLLKKRHAGELPAA